MKPDTFSTQALRPRDQFGAWREWYSPVFEVIPKGRMSAGFPGETRLWTLDRSVMSRTSAPPGHVLRTKDHLRRDPADHWVISYCMRGGFVAKTADAEVEVPARVPFLWSLRHRNCRTSGRMSIGCSSSWRATHSAIWRPCSTPQSDQR